MLVVSENHIKAFHFHVKNVMFLSFAGELVNEILQVFVSINIFQSYIF